MPKMQGTLEVRTNGRLLVDARQSGRYESHRDYVDKMFRHYHGVRIKKGMFTELVFDYKKDGRIIIHAHKDCYETNRD